MLIRPFREIHQLVGTIPDIPNVAGPSASAGQPVIDDDEDGDGTDDEADSDEAVQARKEARWAAAKLRKQVSRNPCDSCAFPKLIAGDYTPNSLLKSTMDLGNVNKLRTGQPTNKVSMKIWRKKLRL